MKTNYYLYAQEILERLVRDEYPDLTDTQVLLFKHYTYYNKLPGLSAIILSGGTFVKEDRLSPIVEKGLVNFIYDQSEEVVEIIKKMGDDLDHNLDTLKSMLIEKDNTEIEDICTNKEICGKCKEYGLTCCMRMSCEFYLEDIKEEYRNEEGFKKLLDTGLVVLDKWDADDEMEETYYLRIKNVLDGDKKISLSYGGTCILLGEEGCRLSYAYRPTSGGESIPNESPSQCTPVERDGEIRSKVISCKSFLPVQEDLINLVTYENTMNGV